MIIRKYQPVNKERIIELLRLNTPRYFSPSEEKDLIDYLEYHSENSYVVEIDDIIVGIGGFNLSEDGETARLSWDIFHPQSQGIGLGTTLTNFRIQRIKEIAGVKTLSVRTSQFAYKFYERYGMEIREIVKDYWEAGFDLYRLERPLSSASIIGQT
jgi:ribosomal protein S18 acetylase RimI-like enzyme